jgi:hypothetical protein
MLFSFSGISTANLTPTLKMPYEIASPKGTSVKSRGDYEIEILWRNISSKNY